ncbi:linear amide C-N hydrolase [Maridesulfovibrio sp.]|uniref:linear amide C-N hydrolase n=1 Tax=Maridesulfovibrio sp. TaxID=2795000 RepID=UPI003BACEB54
MKVVNRLFAFCFALVVSVLLCSEYSKACTSLVLEAEDGAFVYGRTMEWGAFDLNSRLVVVPRGYEFKGHTPDGKSGLSWKAKYGAVALDAIEKDYLTDGMNEKGLVVGVLYLPGFAKFHPYDPAKAQETLSSLDLCSYLLTRFATVDEVREGVQKIRVVSIPEPTFGGEVPIHFTVIDKSGKAIVIQYLDGELNIFDNPLRVLTNAPPFDWHMINLRNYLGLSAAAHSAKEIENINFAPIGAGSGFIGLPGDFTPPSRFVRAVVYTQTARKTPNGDETVYEVFRILDNFNLPLGAAEGSDTTSGDLKGMRSSTIWTTVADTKNLKLYYHTQHNRRVRMVDLKKINFSPSKSGLKRFALDKKKSQDIENVTPR